eukprot:252982_1
MSNLYYPSIGLMVLIYSSLPFTIIQITQFIKLFKSAVSSEDFFKSRHPILHIFYVSCSSFTLYILIPFTILSTNIIIKHSILPFILTDIADILIFFSFFMRTWVLFFDRNFINHLENWIWRREIDAHDSSFIIKHRKTLQSSILLMLILYITLLAPIYGILQVLTYIMYPTILYIIRTVLLTLLWYCTFYIVKNSLNPVSDEYFIRSELLLTIKTSGLFYIMSHILYLMLIYTNRVDINIVLFSKAFLFCITNVSIIYYSCYWLKKQYVFRRKLEILGQIHPQTPTCSFISLFKKEIHFSDIMNAKQGFIALCNHLSNELSLENILFVLQVCQFKAIIYNLSNGQINDNVGKLCGAEDNDNNNSIFSASILNVSWLPIDSRMKKLSPYKIALYLYDKYIDDCADLMINISSENRRNIYRDFQQILQTEDVLNIDNNILYIIFDQAFNEIWNLIANDSFFRFRTTDKFKRLIQVIYPKESQSVKKIYMQLINKKLENERIALESTSQMSATPKFTMFNTDSSTVDKKMRTNSNISINIMDGIKEINGNNIENKNNVDVILDNLVQIPSGSSNMD